MSDSHILANDPVAGIQTIFHGTNEDSGKYILEERQDVTDLVDANRRLYNSVDERARWKNMERVASIPLNVFLDLFAKGMFRGNRLSADDRKWLNDPDNRFFRTRPGRV